MEPNEMTADNFAGHVGSVFTIVAGEDRRELLLDRVEAKPELMEGAKNPDGSDFYTREPFSLVFTGPRKDLFGQASFEIHHAELGAMNLFIKPFAEFGDQAYYESIFC